MMRLIDGDTLTEAFYQKMKELLKSTTTPQISHEALSLLCGASLITEAPTIEPPIEKTGKWKPFDLTYGRNIYFCTACNNASEVPTSMGEPVYKFCPWCGASMEVE